jgi:hypothetical protein
MAEVVIHAPSVDALFDEWSPEPIERRPLRDEVRDHIVEKWVEAKRTGGADALVLLLPATERRENLDDAVRNAVHADMETMEEECRRHWLRRSLRARKTRIGIVLFVVCLLISAGINYGQTDAWSDTLAQTFVVIAWVALWDPGQRVVDAASNRLARKHYAALAAVETRVRWEARPDQPA